MSATKKLKEEQTSASGSRQWIDANAYTWKFLDMAHFGLLTMTCQGLLKLREHPVKTKIFETSLMAGYIHEKVKRIRPSLSYARFIWLIQNALRNPSPKVLRWPLEVGPDSKIGQITKSDYDTLFSAANRAIYKLSQESALALPACQGVTSIRVPNRDMQHGTFVCGNCVECRHLQAEARTLYRCSQCISKKRNQNRASVEEFSRMPEYIHAFRQDPLVGTAQLMDMIRSIPSVSHCCQPMQLIIRREFCVDVHRHDTLNDLFVRVAERELKKGEDEDEEDEDDDDDDKLAKILPNMALTRSGNYYRYDDSSIRLLTLADLGMDDDMAFDLTYFPRGTR